MPKLRKNRIREERIYNETTVDAYGPEEQALGWYYYLENKIQFPFSARCIASKLVSPLRKGETVEGEEKERLDNLIMGAEELLRFSRIRQLLQR